MLNPMERQLSFNNDDKTKRLENEIRKLKARIKQLEGNQSNHNTSERRLIPLYDEKVFEYLFSYDINRENGYIKLTDVKREAMNRNHERLYCAILQVIKPASKELSKNAKNKYCLLNPTLHELSEKEFKIFSSGMAKIIKEMYKIKTEFKKIQEVNNEI